MSGALLLDTHVVLWLETGSERLRWATRSLIDACWIEGGTIFVSALTAWEIALLADSGRIELDAPPSAWLERFLGRPGISATPLNWRGASLAYSLDFLEDRDPADRLLIATAIELACPLVTYDARIIEFGATHGRCLGFIATDGG